MLRGLYDYTRCIVTIRYNYIEVTIMTSYMRSVHNQNIELSPTGSTIEYIVQHVTNSTEWPRLGLLAVHTIKYIWFIAYFHTKLFCLDFSSLEVASEDAENVQPSHALLLGCQWQLFVLLGHRLLLTVVCGWSMAVMQFSSILWLLPWHWSCHAPSKISASGIFQSVIAFNKTVFITSPVWLPGTV